MIKMKTTDELKTRSRFESRNQELIKIVTRAPMTDDTEEKEIEEEKKTDEKKKTESNHVSIVGGTALSQH